MKIGVVGTGYVGLVAGVCFADVGHDVICVDTDANKINLLKDGKVPIYEPGLEDIIKSAKKRLEFTTDLSIAVDNAEVIFIAVGTPEKSDGNADLSATELVLKSICTKAKNKKFIVLKSTVPVGTHKWAQGIIKESSKIEHEIINNPEFLKEGAAIDDFLKPDRVVIGCQTEEARSKMKEIYSPFVKTGNPILYMSNASAELTKYAANAFLSVKISFANELALLSDKVGADYKDVRAGFTSDSRINPSFFFPGVGYGGSCFPKDVQALIQTARKHDTSVSIVESADKVNDKQKLVLVEKVKSHFGSNLKGKTFAIWGLAFKPRTDDVREAPAGYIIRELIKLGAQIVTYDPVATDSAKKYFNAEFVTADSPISATKNADALIIVTEWNEFRNPDFYELKKSLKNPVIFDGRNTLNISEVVKNGFTYYCIGRQIMVKAEV